ncbi:MAG: PAS domain-containing sensor histidine kinase, partial [Chloroflexi bacterium]|nr:PAS domain-containing sensor histidine kinase [Chloroflexota bacterium]
MTQAAAPADVDDATPDLGPLFELSRDAVIVVGAKTGRIVRWSPAATTLFGYSALEATRLEVDRLVPRRLRRRVRTALGLVSTPEEGWRPDRPVELTALRRSGEAIPIEISVRPIAGAAAEPLVLVLVRDVSERDRLKCERARLQEEQVARAQAEAALATRDEVLALVTHDLKGPLTSIRGFAGILQERATNAGVLATWLGEGLSRIDLAARKMAQMINELLDAARLQQGQPLDLFRRATDLVAVAREVVDDVQRSARHDVTVEATVADLSGNWDAFRLERAFTNLLTNAIKFSPEGGKITVRIAVDSVPQGRWAVVEVRDRGVGIPPGDLTRIFDRFHRASNVVGRIPGTGIGLAGVRQIVEQHGGT